MPGGEGFGSFWDLCRFAVEAGEGAEPAIVGVGEAVFGFQRTIELMFSARRDHDGES